MKKHYKSASYRNIASGFALLLDEQHASTSMGQSFTLPNTALAEAIAQEWQGQSETIRKETMPLTQIASIAIDLAMEQSEKVAADILPYAETDLVCYRAGDNPELLAQQAQLLDPLLAWTEQRFGVALMITDGMMPVKQPAGNRAKFAEALAGYDAWRMAALAATVKPLGSLIIALALIEGRIGGSVAFRLAHLEEAYETEKWGNDEEKDKRLSALEAEITAAERFLALLNVK